MGVSLEVVGFHPPDKKWKEMKAAYDACKRVGIEPPVEVLEFFDWREPDDRGVECDFIRDDKYKPLATEWKEEMAEGVEIELGKLPANITHLRVYISY